MSKDDRYHRLQQEGSQEWYNALFDLCKFALCEVLMICLSGSYSCMKMYVMLKCVSLGRII